MKEWIVNVNNKNNHPSCEVAPLTSSPPWKNRKSKKVFPNLVKNSEIIIGIYKRKCNDL